MRLTEEEPAPAGNVQWGFLTFRTFPWLSTLLLSPWCGRFDKLRSTTLKLKTGALSVCGRDTVVICFWLGTSGTAPQVPSSYPKCCTSGLAHRLSAVLCALEKSSWAEGLEVEGFLIPSYCLVSVPMQMSVSGSPLCVFKPLIRPLVKK